MARIAAALVALLGSALPAAAAEGIPDKPEKWFVYAVIAVIFLASIIALAMIRSAISDSKFSLGEALSEETKVSLVQKDAAGTSTPVIGADGKPIEVTILAGSVSRVVALAGGIALLLMFIGFGTFVMYDFAATGVVPDLDKVINFLVAGLTLFAPYVVNKFSGLFDGLTKKS